MFSPRGEAPTDDDAICARFNLHVTSDPAARQSPTIKERPDLQVVARSGSAIGGGAGDVVVPRCLQIIFLFRSGFNPVNSIYYFMIVAFLGNYRLTFGLVLLTDMTYEFDFRSTRL